MRIVYFLGLFLLMGSSVRAQVSPPSSKPKPQKTITQKPKPDTVIVSMPVKPVLSTSVKDLQSISLPLFPASSLNQALKGTAAGLYVQEQSGEPGVYQYMHIRGTLLPLFSAEDLVRSQPLIVIDGIPVISNEHPFAYDVQLYDYSRIGPSTNLLAGIDLDNVESVQLLKDISQYAVYGPKAANGVIYVKTKTGKTKKAISFDSYFGIANPAPVTTFNGATENKFREQFYNRYASMAQMQNYAAFLKDSLNTVYYGPSNWTDSYYKKAAVYSINASATGGTERANFKFSLGKVGNNGVADDTRLDKYAVGFNLNMKPVKWMTATANIMASRMDRKRNRYSRDRIAEGRYLPDLSQPLSPNNDIYGGMLTAYKEAVDDNLTNTLNGYFNMGLTFGKVRFNSFLGVSYTDGSRDLYNPTTLLETIAFASNYFGYSQRLVIDNTINYSYKINDNNTIDFLGGQSINWDTYRYNYAYGYRNGTDYIKVNLLNKDDLQPSIFTRRLIFRFLDKTVNNQVSFYGKADYKYKNWLTVSGLLRADGISNMQPTNRWFYSPVVSASWNIKNHLLIKNKTVTDLKLRGSFGILGRNELNDRYAQGSQYVVDFGWSGEPLVPSYAGTVGLVRPYTKGYIGYDIPWSYNEQISVGFDFSLWKGRLNGIIDLYANTAKDQLLGVPGLAEYGYTKAYKPGMDVNNSGVDLTLTADLLPARNKVKWTISLGANYNRNTLRSLPDGRKSIIIGNRLLQVGNSVDQFWLLENNGIYSADNEVEINPANQRKLNYEGVDLKAGDPRWKDLNGDFTINEKDKKLMGHMMPVVSGNFSNTISYKKISLGFDFYYNLGKNILNKEMANRFDFINRESSNDINSIKEITFWQEQGNVKKYPLYNVWSSVIPYRAEQDLFLENASFLKLRTASLGYDMTQLINRSFKKADVNRFFIYATVNNVFTLTPYSGRDPELVDYTGYDTGYGLPIPRTYTVGVKMSL
ncbi:SusC/RagA family TonB-linked outer membrane protein [Pedobacter hiemivivus]|uniref:SusC/RagA family TonB-linked outer membrane protein n=1 Tax=Pedobacter hiemivivus TaxID=2530454 RepID=A0A4U1GJZ1_9SPHI|nr:SusC/RagA family TonB-linked outer membrane protein [Pedobacter hiemivivus]TKC63659.1 SusC/RagA family TonB-linked outer membrane protein [Pedobacter hiemivivus]